MSLLWKVLRIGLGFALILIGLVGVIVPLMPGWILIIGGLAILATDVPWARRILDWGRRKITPILQCRVVQQTLRWFAEKKDQVSTWWKKNCPF